MQWIALVLSSTVISAGQSILDKRLMEDEAVHPFICSASFGIVGLLIGAIGVFVLPLPTASTALMSLAAGGIFTIAAWRYYVTVAQTEISRIVPLLRLTVVQTLVIEWLIFGVVLSGRQWAAFWALVFSSLLIGLAPQGKHMPSGGLLLRMLLITSLLAVNTVLMSEVYRSASLWAGVVWEQLGRGIAAALAGALLGIRGDLQWKCVPPRTWAILIINQALRAIGGLAPGWAIAHGASVAMVGAIESIRPVCVWLLALLFLHERIQRRDLILKGGALICAALGMYWLM